MAGPIDLELLPQLLPGVRLRYDHRTSRYLLLSPERGLLLNESAAASARRCDGRRRVSDIVSELVRDGVPVSRAEADIRELLGQFSERGLVRLRTAP